MDRGGRSLSMSDSPLAAALGRALSTILPPDIAQAGREGWDAVPETLTPQARASLDQYPLGKYLYDPALQAAGGVLGAGSAAFHAGQQALQDIGVPRDLTALPEAFAGSPADLGPPQAMAAAPSEAEALAADPRFQQRMAQIEALRRQIASEPPGPRPVASQLAPQPPALPVPAGYNPSFTFLPSVDADGPIHDSGGIDGYSLQRRGRAFSPNAPRNSVVDTRGKSISFSAPKEPASKPPAPAPRITEIDGEPPVELPAPSNNDSSMANYPLRGRHELARVRQDEKPWDEVLKNLRRPPEFDQPSQGPLLNIGKDGKGWTEDTNRAMDSAQSPRGPQGVIPGRPDPELWVGRANKSKPTPPANKAFEEPGYYTNRRGESFPITKPKKPTK